METDYKAKYEALVRLILNDEGQGIYPCGHLTSEQRDAFGKAPSDAYKCGWNDAIIDGDTKVKRLLDLADAAQSDDDQAMLLASGYCWVRENGCLAINMNDVWAWALSWCAEVPPDQVKEVARLFKTYGNAGLLYWHSCQENNMRSEFADNNRAIDFVRNEERIRKEVPDSNKRAYHKVTYVLGLDEATK